MCLTVSFLHHGFNPSPKIAKKDIVVYKRLRETSYGYYTPYMDKRVQFGIIANGIARLRSNLENPKDRIIEKGIHAHRTKKSAIKQTEKFHLTIQKVFIAIIPKNTNYYIGKHNEIVSSQLLIFETEEAYNNYLVDETLHR